MIGTSVVSVEDFRVEAGKVEEFARAVKDDNPAHRDGDAAAEQGFDRVPAPITFERVSSFPRYSADDGGGIDIGFAPEYSIHGEQAYEIERPLQVGDVLTGTTTLTEVYQRDGSRGGTMTFAVMETEYTDETGDVVMSASLTVIETAGAIEEDADD